MSTFRKIIQVTILYWIMFDVESRLYAQDPVFSQYYASPLQINAAFTGLTDGPRIGLNYRNQWPFIDQSFRTYVTYNIFYDQFFPNLKSGFGLELTADDAGGGFIQTNKVNVLYGYKIPINDRNHVIKGGIELGYVHMNYAWDKFIFGDQIDPISGYQTGGSTIISKELVPNKTSTNYIDVGLGLLYYSPSFYLGAAVKHLNSPDQGILQKSIDGGSGLPPRISLNGGFEISLIGNSRAKTHIFSPSLLYIRQSAFSQLNIGGQYQYGPIFTGLFYRQSRNNPDALIFSLGIKKGNWKMAYSFDFTISELSIDQGGTHEISLLFNIVRPSGKSSNVSDCFEAFR